MSKFSYLTKKIKKASFFHKPFPHIIVDNFINKTHFNQIVNDPQITIKADKVSSTKKKIEILTDHSYEPIDFPGCVKNIDDYIKFIDTKKLNRKKIIGYGRDLQAGFGLTMRLTETKSDILTNVENFFKSDEFNKAIKNKFGIEEQKLDIDFGIQKNLNYYEISPHPDTSKKALTYMINIYKNNECQKYQINTQLNVFKEKYNYIYDFWRYSQKFDRIWVPWNWCTTKKTHSSNNSLIMFKPSYNTLHSVKLDYDHLKFQRNQIYGNLWYQSNSKIGMSYHDLDLYKSRSFISEVFLKISNAFK